MSLLRTKSLDQGILSPIKEQETTPDGNEQVNRFSEFTGMPAIGAGDGDHSVADPRDAGMNEKVKQK